MSSTGTMFSWSVDVLRIMLVCAAAAMGVNGQNRGSEGLTESFVREKIAILMRDTLHEGEHTVNGVKVWVRVHPSNKALKQVRRYGDSAVPALADYLRSDDARARELAMRFLGSLGGSRIVEPLRAVVENDTSAGMRELALRWLTAAPWDTISQIKHAAQTDDDPQVRETARGIVARYSKK
jgi:hypothetical protein